MSRIGLDQNIELVPLTGWLSDTSARYDALLSNTSAINPPTTGRDGSPETTLTQLQWTITIGGLSYNADDTAHYLAVSVLMVYVVLAMTHAVYVLVNGRFSKAWKGFEDMLALAYNSPPPSKLLPNASAGVSARSTYRLRVKIRAQMQGEGTDGHEQARLVMERPEKGEAVEEFVKLDLESIILDSFGCNFWSCTQSANWKC